MVGEGIVFLISNFQQQLKSLAMHQNLFGTKLALNCIDSVEFQKCRMQCIDTIHHLVNSTEAFRKGQTFLHFCPLGSLRSICFE